MDVLWQRCLRFCLPASAAFVLPLWRGARAREQMLPLLRA